MKAFNIFSIHHKISVSIAIMITLMSVMPVGDPTAAAQNPLVDPHGIALDVANGKMYWTDDSADRIQRANLDGSDIENLITQGLDDPYGIALDVAGGKMYWADEGENEILRANLDGSNIQILVSRGLDDPHGIALDVANGKMYWTDDSADRIQRANLDGSNIENLITQGLSDPYGIALDVANGKMYWADEGTNRIQRANLDGSLIETLVPRESSAVSNEGDDIFSLSTDATPVRSGDTFTLRLRANDVTDLAGWQTDISFDPALLEAVEVNEGDFLNVKSGDTFFLQGTIDNTAGKITGINTAKFKGSGNGTGTLLLVTFKAKATGETRVTFSNFVAGSRSGETLSSEVPEIKITIEDQAFPAWDVNQDGQVNVHDLTLVAQHLGADASVNRQADVNGDGTINVLDLIVVAQHLGESTAAAAPSSVDAIDSLELDAAMVQAWIAQARIENDGSLAFQQGIENLQQLLASLLPDKTALLPNYPNPFNPETWIPYDLAEATDVTVHIYAAEGTLIRTLALGHQTAGIYQTRSRAAYWDGKNEFGEPVASGVYFYTLTAGDFNATRKMLIRK